MTTPAINRNITQSRTGILTQVRYVDGQEVLRTSGPQNGHGFLWDRESRPASGTSNFPYLGIPMFRNCRGWTHSGRLLKRNDIGETVVVTTQEAPNRQLIETFTEGGFWSYTPQVMPPIPNGLASEAETKALNRLKRQDIHLGNFLAESGKTFHMVGSAMRSIASQVKTWRRMNSAAAWRKVYLHEHFGNRPWDWKQIPDSWLALQYGWTPLLSDILGALAHMYATQTRPSLFKVSGVAKRDMRTTQTFTGGNWGSLTTVEAKTEAEVFVNLWYRMKYPLLAELSRLGLINPAEIVWECTKYSFVVDWFVPISSWLSALTADFGYEFVSGSRSEMRRKQERVVATRHPRIAGKTFSGSELSISGKEYDFKRSCYGASPVPGVYVKNPLSVVHVLNSLALLQQAFR